MGAAGAANLSSTRAGFGVAVRVGVIVNVAVTVMSGVNDSVGKPVPSGVAVDVRDSPPGVAKTSVRLGVWVGVLVAVGVEVSAVGAGWLAVASITVAVSCSRSPARVGVGVDLLDFKIPKPASPACFVPVAE